MKRISVVIPNWNGSTRLVQLFSSLNQQTEKALEVIVVDNHSQDGSEQVAQAAGAHWIPLEQNFGFAVAVNAGIRQASGDAVAILNNDVTLAPGFLGQLGDALDQYAFAAPKILMTADPSRLDGTFDLTSRGLCSWRAGHGFPADAAVWNRARTIPSAPMTAAIFRRSLFDSAGLLDPQFGSYLEDVDFGLRCARLKVDGCYEPKAVAWHEGSATLGGAWNPRSVERVARNQTLLAKKYTGVTWPAFVGQALWGLAAMRRAAATAWIQGKIEGLRLDVDRQTTETGAQELNPILCAQENEIRELMAETGTHERYWKAYFALVGKAA